MATEIKRPLQRWESVATRTDIFGFRYPFQGYIVATSGGFGGFPGGYDGYNKA